MDIKLLPASTKCLIDSNILLYHIGGSSIECKDFFGRLADGEIEGFVTTIIIAEALHRQMLIEAVAKGVVSPSKVLKKLKDNPSAIQGLSDYAKEIEKMIGLPINVIEVSHSDIIQSFALRQSHGLFVNDSINLASALRFGINDIVTRDSDFARLPHAKIWEPTDI